MNTMSDMTTHTAMAGLTVSSVMGWAPFILGVPAAIWYCIKIYDYFKHKEE